MADDSKPTLHHMDNSQSQRILWLLEELEIPYNVELHFRIQSGPDRARAPPELASLHPLGKSPLLVTAASPEHPPRVIAESAAIMAYLLATYDPAKRFQSTDWIRDESLTSLAASSMGNLIIVKVVLTAITFRTPFVLRPLVRLLTGGLDGMFTEPEFKKMLAYLESELPPGQDWFSVGTKGGGPGKADFMLSFPLDMVVDNKWWVADFARQYPRVAAWRERCLGRDAWKRALDKGNGYDMNQEKML